MQRTTWVDEWRSVAARLAETQGTMLLGIVYLTLVGPMAILRRVARMAHGRPPSTWFMRPPPKDQSLAMRRPY
jgi:hypothetical protein